MQLKFIGDNVGDGYEHHFRVLEVVKYGWHNNQYQAFVQFWQHQIDMVSWQWINVDQLILF